MSQMGFFNLSDCLDRLDDKQDALILINKAVPWEEFRPILEKIWRKKDVQRKSRAGRKPTDVILMFKMLVLASLYNLSDDKVEFFAQDRLTFRRFLGIGMEGRVPDAKTVWVYGDMLARSGKMEELFHQFNTYLERQGYKAQGGQILDASIVQVPRNRNTREENAAIKKGEVPEKWEEKPAKRRQKDVDARWVKKNGQSQYGYKNHVNVDRKHKLVRRFHVSDAAQHDSQATEHLLSNDNSASGVWADSAYRSDEIERKIKERNLKSHIHRKGKRGKPLSEWSKQGNHTKSKVRVRVEHVFGAQANDMGGTLVRSIGLTRAKAKIGMKNLTYNMRRYCHLLRTSSNPLPA